MRAVVYQGPKKIGVQNVPDPRIQAPTDAIVRLTTTAICGSDLHMFEGRTDMQTGGVLGHENMGVISQIGESVASLKPGDRVVLPFNIGCGFCFNCVRGFTSACLTVNPQGIGGGYGYAGMGPFGGGQAELLRVPYADFNALKLPGQPGDALEDDFVLLSDIFPTGYHGTELAHVQPGDTVAVYGAGPVGLLAAYSALLRGASEVYVVDQVAARLAKARSIGAIPIDFSQGDPAQQILEMRRAKGLPPGQEKMPGVMCGIDAVGYEAIDYDNPKQQNPAQIFTSLVQVVNPTGHLGIVGVYFPQDPGGVNKQAKHGVFALPWGELFDKGLTVGVGQTPVKKYNVYLRDLIIAGRAKPSFIISHRLPLEAAPDAYQRFDERTDGYTKVVLKPEMAAA